MLDCGAFSAWRRGEVIDLPAYIEFVKRHEHLLDCYVALDVIPGSLGRAPGSLKRPRTVAEVKVSGAQSYANLQAMKNAGLRQAIPTFHQGEELCWLERMLRDGESYIGLSPAKNMSWDIQQPWLDRIFAILTDRAGNPLVKTHGFGIASVDFLKRYPRRGGARRPALQPRSLNASEREVWEWLIAARQPIKWSRPKLYFSTQNDKQWKRALAAVGARHHLLSYWHLKERPGVLASYVNG